MTVFPGWNLSRARREGARFVRRNRLFTFLAVLILSLGIAASSLSLSVLWLVSHPKTPALRVGSHVTIGEESLGGPLGPVSWRTVRQSADALGVPVAAYAEPVSAVVETDSRKQPIRVAAVSANLFESVTVPLTMGADLSAVRQESDGADEVILSRRLATDLFGTAAAAIDHSIRINRIALRVIGIAPKDFDGLLRKDADAWIPPRLVVPLYLEGGMASGKSWRDVQVFYAIGVVAPGVGSGRIGNELAAIKRLGSRLSVLDGLTTDVRRDQQLKTWSGLALFLASCLTLASGLSFGGLLLARTPRQLDEVRLKQTLGAGHVQLFLDLAVGPLLVVGSGLLGSLVLAFSATHALRQSLGSAGTPFPLSLQDVALGVLTQVPLAFSVAICMALIPGLRLLRDSGAPRLSYAGTGTKHSTRLLDTIVVAQVVCSICSCLVAVMVGRSALELRRERLGYVAEGRSIIAIAPKSNTFSFSTYGQGGSPMAQAFDRSSRRLAALPGVTATAVAVSAPLDPSARSAIVSDPALFENAPHTVSVNGVTPNYFEVLGTPLLLGHVFTSGLLDRDPSEAIVNETLRKQLWPTGNPVGRTLNLHFPAGIGMSLHVTVCGVTADQRMAGPKDSPPPIVYLPLSGNVFSLFPRYFIVNGREPLFRLDTVVNDELSSGPLAFSVTHSYSLERRLRDLVGEEERRVWVALAGAGVIAAIAFIGLYSSLLHYISSKRREMAIRICCGASPGVIFRIVFGRAARAGAIASIISLLCWNPIHYLAGSGVIGRAYWSSGAAALTTLISLLVAGAIAVYPAWQASRTSPAEGIREY